MMHINVTTWLNYTHRHKNIQGDNVNIFKNQEVNL